MNVMTDLYTCLKNAKVFVLVYGIITGIQSIEECSDMEDETRDLKKNLVNEDKLIMDELYENVTEYKTYLDQVRRMIGIYVSDLSRCINLMLASFYNSLLIYLFKLDA